MGFIDGNKQPPKEKKELKNLMEIMDQYRLYFTKSLTSPPCEEKRNKQLATCKQNKALSKHVNKEHTIWAIIIMILMLNRLLQKHIQIGSNLIQRITDG